MAKKPKEGQVVFRRIRGRIVPIRVSKKQLKKKNLQTAGIQIGTGLILASGLGAAAGRAEVLAGRLFSKRGGFADRSTPKHRTGKIRRKKVDPKQLNLGRTFVKGAKKRSGFSLKSKSLGVLLGSFLVGVGIERILDTSRDKEKARELIPAAELAGVAAGGAVLFGFKAGQSSRISKGFRKTRTVARKAAKALTLIVSRGKVRL